MSENASPLKKNFLIILVPALSFLSFTFLYLFRHVDDNRLTSWKWTFAYMDMVWFVPVLALGMALAYTISLVSYERYKPALTLFITSFAATALFWSQPEVIIDVSRYFTYAKHLKLFGPGNFLSQWGNAISPWTDLPLIPFIYGLIFKFFGESRMYIQLFNSTLFSLTVISTYCIGKTLWSDDVGYFAGAMIMGIPYIFSQVPLMLVDIPTMFLLTFSVYSCIKAIEHGGAWIVLSSLVIFFTIYSKYSTWMMLSVVVVIFAVYLIKNVERRASNVKRQTAHEGQRTTHDARRAYLLRSVSVGIITLILSGIAFFLKSDVMLSQIVFLREYQAPGLKRWGESFVSTFLFQTHPFITISAIFSVYVAIQKRDIKFLIIAWLIILIILLQIRRSRYVMVVFPMFTLTASYGLCYLKSSDLKRHIVSSIVAFSLVIALFAFLPFLKTMSEENLHQAGTYLNSIDAQVVRVFTTSSDDSVVNPSVTVPVLDLFTNKKLRYHYNEKKVPPMEKIKESPLRFTWEYENPDYYKNNVNDNRTNTAIVIISNEEGELPDYLNNMLTGFEQKKIFKRSTGIFRYSPIVTIYLPTSKD